MEVVLAENSLNSGVPQNIDRRKYNGNSRRVQSRINSSHLEDQFAAQIEAPASLIVQKDPVTYLLFNTNNEGFVLPPLSKHYD